MRDRISAALLTLFFYHTSLFCGWVICGFVLIYSPVQAVPINNNLAHYMQIQPIWLGSGLLFSALYWASKKFYHPCLASVSVTRQVGWQTVFLVLLLADFILYRFSWHAHIFELISFVLAIALTLRWGVILTRQNLPGWQHPTTIGSLIISTLLNGCALLSLFVTAGDQKTVPSYFFMILLGFELLILYARFNYLAKHSQATNKLARLLMSRHLLPFGMRIIVGIFMPLIFIINDYLIKGETMGGVAILILLGTFSERYLFIITAGEHT